MSEPYLVLEDWGSPTPIRLVASDAHNNVTVEVSDGYDAMNMPQWRRLPLGDLGRLLSLLTTRLLMAQVQLANHARQAERVERILKLVLYDNDPDIELPPPMTLVNYAERVQAQVEQISLHLRKFVVKEG